jgi:hypothetical protein
VAYDERLADRVREILAGDPALGERKMFGGLAFMLAGKHVLRHRRRQAHAPTRSRAGRTGARTNPRAPMNFTGRPMTGMVYVAPEGLRGKALRSWVEQAAGFARTLPPKRAPRSGEGAIGGPHHEPLARNKLLDCIGVCEPASEERGDERHLRADGERSWRLPVDARDVLVPGSRVVRVGRVGGDLAPRPVDLDLRLDVDCHRATRTRGPVCRSLRTP